MSWTITPAHIDGLARGAAVLGTGGGGDPYIGALLARQALTSGDVTVVVVAHRAETVAAASRELRVTVASAESATVVPS